MLKLLHHDEHVHLWSFVLQYNVKSWAREGVDVKHSEQSKKLGTTTSASFSDDVLFSDLTFMSIILAFICIILLYAFPGWYKESNERTGLLVDVKPFSFTPMYRSSCRVHLLRAFDACC